ncbi:DUF7544 domain-containing protein [Halegenticoccus tardaugens]|uniref:DUF7544 domain-containing protein n=1 Tax=Halegenticoccus tardaugens TaxID=2071624 RepID=UPI00100C2264|nr:hypothetical protein [Halegenticoccus tardaugens]
MPWYAFDAVDDALRSTREFLFPFSIGRWLRLAVIVFFLGGGGGGGLNNVSSVANAPPSPGPGPTPGGPTPGGPMVPGIGGSELAIVAAAIAVVAGIALLFGVISSTMRFVFLDALRTDDVRIRGPFRRRFGKGVRLFGFQFGLSLLLGLPFAAVGLLAWQGTIDLGALAGIGTAGLAALALVGLALALLVALFFQFTVQFVAPVMIATDSGVIEGWRRFWPTLRGEPAQFLVFVVIRFLLGLGVGLASGLLFAIFAAIVAIVGLVAGLAVAAALGGFAAATQSPVGIAVIVLLGLFGLLALLLVWLPIGILVQTFFTTYELSTLGAANRAFALLPRRTDEDGGNGETGGGGENGSGGDDGDGGGGDDEDDGGSGWRGGDDRSSDGGDGNAHGRGELSGWDRQSSN